MCSSGCFRGAMATVPQAGKFSGQPRLCFFSVAYNVYFLRWAAKGDPCRSMFNPHTGSPSRISILDIDPNKIGHKHAFCDATDFLRVPVLVRRACNALRLSAVLISNSYFGHGSDIIIEPMKRLLNQPHLDMKKCWAKKRRVSGSSSGNHLDVVKF